MAYIDSDTRCNGHGRAFSTQKVLANSFLNEEIFRLTVTWTGPAPKAGQFFLVRPARTSIFLGRPISVATWDEPGQLGFLIALRGSGTQELGRLASGEEVELIGPLGSSWLEVAKGELAKSMLPQKPLALIGGGIGIAPLIQLARELPKDSFDFYGGFRSRSYALEDLKPSSLVIASEDGSEGHTGRIPDFFPAHNYRMVFACGPEPMLKAIQQICLASKTPCIISMERRMACGVGACLGCTVATIHGNKRCCVEGPIFDAQEILFDE